MLFDQMKGKLIINWHIWFYKVPVWLIGLGVAGIILSLLAHRKLAKHQVPLHIAFALGITAVLLVQRPNNPWARVWSFSIAFFMIWAAAGLIELIKKRPFQNFILTLALTGAVWGAWQTVQTPLEKSKENLVAEVIIERIGENDLVLVEGDYAAPIEYYLLKAGKSHRNFQRELPFERVFLVIVTKGDYTFDAFMDKFVPKYALDANTLKPLRTFGHYEVYEILPLQ